MISVWRNVWVKTWALCCCIVYLVGCGEEDLVFTSYGVLSGRDAGDVRTFLGVPFAKPPLGELRWQPPRPPEAWSGVRQAAWPASGCIQGGKPTGAIGSSEDCLYLNIWAPKTPGPHPVMLWLHGGGLILGSGNELHYQGENLAKERDVVVITINYRLSFMGFLATPQLTEEGGYGGSGNQGLLDQVAALEWVQQEIAKFGGDPDNVTVFGESGGAISGCALMASPLAQDLFNKVIMQSGSCRTLGLNSLAEAEQVGMEFMANLGCADAPDPLGCARSMSKLDILDAIPIGNAELFLKLPNDWVFEPLPTIDNHLLPDHPVTLLEQGLPEDIAILIGSNSNEGSLFTFAHDHGDTEEEYASFVDSFYPGLSAEVMGMYPLQDFPTAGEAVSTAAGDAAFTCAGREIADLVSDAGQPVYQYYFTQSVNSFVTTLFAPMRGTNGPEFGTFHSSEIPFVFGNPSVLGNLYGEREQVSTTMMGYWANFARTGDPNGEGLPEWPAYSRHERAYKELNADMPTGYQLKQQECDFWQEMAVLD